MGKGKGVFSGKNTDEQDDLIDEVEETEDVNQAIASLPSAKSIASGDDFTGEKNSEVVNLPRDADGNPLIHVALPLDKPGKQQEYEDNGYVLATTKKFGVNPLTKKPEYLRTRGPMPGHLLMVCGLDVREKEIGRDRMKRERLNTGLESGKAAQVKEHDDGKGGTLEAPDIRVTRPG